MLQTSLASALRKAAALALAAGLVALASAAGALANLMDVRVGVHPDHTRIVIETDAEAPYVVDPSEREVLVHVDAEATAEAVTAKSPHLIWVKVEPSAIGTDVRIQLKQPVDVKPLVLQRPHRIVLDLYPKAGARAPAREPEPAPEPLPAPEVLPEEAPSSGAGEPEAELPPLGAPPMQDEPGMPDEGAEEPFVPAPPEGEAAAEPDEVVEPAPEEELAGEPTPPSDPGEGGVAEPAAPEGEAEPSLPTTPVAPAPTGSLFGSPYVLVAAAVVLFGVFLWLHRRLRSSEAPRIPPLRDEDSEPFEAPPRNVALGEAPRSAEPLFDVEPDALTPLPKDDLPIARGMLRADPEAGDENERRIAHLEKRIEELADAKDRLERQVAAQTEELRVQRAAIARTQRVLRSIAPRNSDDSSSEPVRG